LLRSGGKDRLTVLYGAVQLPYMATGPSRTERIELRAQPSRARRIRQAARVRGQSLSAFMLDAASASAEEVLAAASTTTVPPAFFDDLWAALEKRSKPSAALARRARAARRVSQR
jgi:uncharacterized protein (DUF1778 family)